MYNHSIEDKRNIDKAKQNYHSLFTKKYKKVNYEKPFRKLRILSLSNIDNRKLIKIRIIDNSMIKNSCLVALKRTHKLNKITYSALVG